jgi:uncharacterized membrane protein
MFTTAQTLTIPEKGVSAVRIRSVDILRGIIMVIMALDHTRDFFSNFHGGTLNYDAVGLSMYFTRWITHFCAPVFVFLSGASVFLSMRNGKSKKQASWMLFTRGIWLIILELTIIKIGWSFNFDFHGIFVQVIWAIGWSMIFLSLLIWLPMPLIAAIGLVIIFGHNEFDNIISGQTAFPTLWRILHQPGRVTIYDSYSLFILYPIVPWIGVMAVGYCFGKILSLPGKNRDRWVYTIGVSAIMLFIILRYSLTQKGLAFYGDPHPWQPQNTFRNSLLDFIRCEKYPPSLMYLLMTLGPSITLMPLFEKWSNPISRFFTVYGRVPMFYYILHIFLIHGMALTVGVLSGFPVSIFTDISSLFNATLHWGFSLPWVYFFWMSTVAILYLPCRWYMNIKMKYKKWWMSYL